MDKVVEIDLLPINSFELETHLSELGLALLKCAKEYDFSRKCMGVGDCDFIQAVVIAFISEIKTDFIAYYAISSANLPRGKLISINGSKLAKHITNEAVVHAMQRRLKVANYSELFSWLSVKVTNGIGLVKGFLFELKNSVRDFYVKSNWSDKNKGQDKFRLLMTTYSQNTIFTLTPIQDRLKNRADIDLLYITNKYETYKRLLSLGYKYTVYGLSLPSLISARFRQPVFDNFVEQFFANYFFFGTPTGYFRSRFRKLLKRNLSFAVRMYSPIKKVITEYSPNCILVSSSSTIDAQIMIQIGTANGVKIVEITHGMFHDTPILKFQNIPIKLVWNKHQFDLMKKYKPEVNCLIIGNPKHDELLKKFVKEAPSSKYKKPYIVFASTPGNNVSISWVTYLNVLKNYIEIAKFNQDLLFIFKLHPNEDKTKIVNITRTLKAPENLIVEKDVNIYELIYNAKVVIVITSTVGYEALLLNKKIICYEIENSEKWMPLSEYNLARGAKDFVSLNRAIRESLNETVDVENSEKSYFVYSDGQAIDASIKIILSQ